MWPRSVSYTHLDVYKRQPLTTIRMAAEVLHAHRARFDPPAARSSELLAAELDRFEELLTDLLEISRFDAGAAELALDDIDLVALTAEEIDALQRLAAEFGTVLTLDADAKCIAEVDGRRIRRILRNLITNALSLIHISSPAREPAAVRSCLDLAPGRHGRGRAPPRD